MARASNNTQKFSLRTVLCRRLTSCQLGGTIIEAVIVLPFFLYLAFMGVQVMVFAYRAATIQYAATEAVNKAAVGICRKVSGVETTTCDATSSVPFDQQRAIYAKNFAVARAQAFGITLDSTVEICVVATSQLATPCTAPILKVPPAGEVVAVRISYPASLIGVPFMNSMGYSSAANSGTSFGGSTTMYGIAIAQVEDLS